MLCFVPVDSLRAGRQSRGRSQLHRIGVVSGSPQKLQLWPTASAVFNPSPTRESFLLQCATSPRSIRSETGNQISRQGQLDPRLLGKVVASENQNLFSDSPDPVPECGVPDIADRSKEIFSSSGHSCSVSISSQRSDL